MSILNQIPKPTINLDFVQMQENRNTLSALRSVVEQIPGSAVDFSALRASKKMSINRLGKYVENPTNLPVLNFDKGVAKGFYASGALTNFFRDSETATDPGQGTQRQCTFGANTMGLGLVGSGFWADGATLTRYYNTDSLSVGTYTFACLVKPNSGGVPTFGVTANDLFAFRGNGTAITTGYVVTEVKDGVYFVRVSGTASGVDNGIARALGNNAIGFEASAIMVVEDDVPLTPYDYIKTVGTTASRSADNFRITGASGAIGQTSGVVQVDVDLSNPGDSVNRRVFSIDSGVESNSIYLRYRDDNLILVNSGNGISKTIPISSSTDFWTNGITRIAFTYEGTRLAYFINGIRVGLVTDGNFVDGKTIIRVGTSTSSNQELRNHIRSVRIWNTADWCTDEIAQLLTRP